MSNELLWKPTKKSTQLTKYIKYIKEKKLHNYKNYLKLHKWSVSKKNEFWKSIWDFTKIDGVYKPPVIKNNKDFVRSKFFINTKLNFTNNVCKKNSKEEAIIFYSEQNERRSVSWKSLGERVNKFSNFLIESGVMRGDRVAAVLPNLPETIIAFLGCAKIGAIWSSCSADFGPKAVVDRFEQIKPKLLIVSDQYYYNNKKHKTASKALIIKKSIKSIKKIVVIPYNPRKKILDNFGLKFTSWNDIMKKYRGEYKSKLFSFNEPLYILYSSGTTGKPKCIVHGAGGSLLQHKKEHAVHCDIGEKSRVFYFTTCGWMMWNWLVSCLASQATILIYEGSPFFPKIDNLFKIVNKENITHFGTGAKFLDTLRQSKKNIKKKFDLKKLKTIFSTGSPLSPESFHYVYSCIKKNVHLASICGGTDIVACFVGGNPNEPVYSGQIQCKALGMDVDVVNNFGKKIKKKKGELVCLSTFVSKPIGFWGDKNNIKFKKTYFSKFKNIWYQGDYAEATQKNGFIVHGRSDATLNSGGIRIGTAELYSVVEKIENVVECAAVEQNYRKDTRIILFIKMKERLILTKKIKKQISIEIKKNLSPKHVPAVVLQVSDIPKTKSGKIVELTIKKIINKEKITNLHSLINPSCLKDFKNRKELIN